MATVREMLDLVNCTIRFTTYEGDYEGEVLLVSTSAGKAMIENTFFLPDRIYMGTLTFLCSEITNLVLLNRPRALDAEERKVPTFGNRRTDDLNLFDDDSDVPSIATEQEYPEEVYDLKLPPGFENIPVDVVTFDSIGEEFRQAINHILAENVIGVSLEGPKSGRHGVISWLCLSTSCCTFLFDIQELGKAVFEEGLRKIMESPKIQKVIHDCREISDCLFHVFNTRLVNVFDTQVAKKLVTMQKSTDCKLDKHVDSLNTCLRNYLKVPEEFLYQPDLSQSYHLSVVSFRLRPPKRNLQDRMIKNVIYLRLLKEKLESELLNPFRRVVEVYLQVLLGSTDRELLLEPSVPDQLPPEVMMQGIQIVRFRDHAEVPLHVASGVLEKKTEGPVQQFLEYCKRYKSGEVSVAGSPFLSSTSHEMHQRQERDKTSARILPHCSSSTSTDEMHQRHEGDKISATKSHFSSCTSGKMYHSKESDKTFVRKPHCSSSTSIDEMYQRHESDKISAINSHFSSCTSGEMYHSKESDKTFTRIPHLLSITSTDEMHQRQRFDQSTSRHKNSTGESGHSIDDSLKNLKLGVTSDCVSKYSRCELDRLFKTAASINSFEKEVAQVKENVSSKDSPPGDVWADLRAEFSKYCGEKNNAKTEKRRFIPAGLESVIR